MLAPRRSGLPQHCAPAHHRRSHTRRCALLARSRLYRSCTHAHRAYRRRAAERRNSDVVARTRRPAGQPDGWLSVLRERAAQQTTREYRMTLIYESKVRSRLGLWVFRRERRSFAVAEGIVSFTLPSLAMRVDQ
ncbi:hypothetical protein HPB50_018668 [Hyalomma asiaticum]|uniref:Uncharacterized protein n=1 Tax=Hyalomma asiaticum TaxID=266040 RepID=A0ACB7SFC2_HYAAI|nr:hypothetical protein HPB50_018668 [Hyalomma asiaticum]